MFFDFVFGFGKVIKAVVSDDTKAVLLNVAGPAGGGEGDALFATDDDEEGEVSDGTEMFTALGIVARSLPPEEEVHTEIIGVRTGDGLVPVAYRDLRMHEAFPDGPGEGTVALVGYGKGFHSLDVVDEGTFRANLHTIYCPFDFDADGVPQQAHSITMDPEAGNRSVTIAASTDVGKGIGLTLNAETKEVILSNEAGDAFISIGDNGITLSATKVVCNGSLVVGNPATAVALSPTSASTKMMISPT
jgi:hypothetical protein